MSAAALVYDLSAGNGIFTTPLSVDTLKKKETGTTVYFVMNFAPGDKTTHYILHRVKLSAVIGDDLVTFYNNEVWTGNKFETQTDFIVSGRARFGTALFFDVHPTIDPQYLLRSDGAMGGGYRKRRRSSRHRRSTRRRHRRRSTRRRA